MNEPTQHAGSSVAWKRKLLGAVLVLTIGCFFAAPILLYVPVHQRLARFSEYGVTATGTITGQEATVERGVTLDRASNRYTRRVLYVRFEDEDERVREVGIARYVSRRVYDSYAVGDSVTIVYLPESLDSAPEVLLEDAAQAGIGRRIQFAFVGDVSEARAARRVAACGFILILIGGISARFVDSRTERHAT